MNESRVADADDTVGRELCYRVVRDDQVRRNPRPVPQFPHDRDVAETVAGQREIEITVE